MVEAVGAAQGGLIGLAVTMPVETVQKTQVALQSRGEPGGGAREIVARLVRARRRGIVQGGARALLHGRVGEVSLLHGVHAG